MSRSDHNAATGGQPSIAAGCPVCAAQSKAVFDDLVAWQARLARSEEAQARFATMRGFCAFHMWLLQQIGDPLSLSHALAPVIEAWADDLDTVAEGSAAAVTVAAAQPRRGACPVCRSEREAGAQALHLAAAATVGPNESGDERLLCMRHLAALLADATPEAVPPLARAHAAGLRSLGAQLRSYLAKREAARRQPATEDEQEAWRRALLFLAGARALRDEGPP